jgi:hypothetical protein
MKEFVFVAFLFFVTEACSQETEDHPRYIAHADISATNTAITIHASNSRPVEQAFAGIRRKYGLVLDYEEGQERDESKFITYRGMKTLKGADITLHVPPPRDSTYDSRRGFVESVLAGFNSAGAGSFSLLRGPGERMNVAPEDPALRILDTKITLAVRSRTIDDTIDEIYSALKLKVGVEIARGGLADGATHSTVVTVGTDATRSQRAI